jgi:hypothetical protein
MAELKTKATAVSVDTFIDKQASESIRDDCRALIKMMQKITGELPVMWGPSIVGFGRYHYKYDSGHEGEMCVAGFSPRKQNLTIYAYQRPDLLRKLGKHKSSKGCIYVKKLADIDMKVLEKIVDSNVKEVRKKYPD